MPVIRWTATAVALVLTTTAVVSQELLDENASSALYVYKGTMSARTIVEHLDRLAAARVHSAP